METVKELEKLLDIDFSHLTANLDTTQNLETINQNSEILNNVFRKFITTNGYLDSGSVDQGEEGKVETNQNPVENIVSNPTNPTILRQSFPKTVVPIEKRNFLKKGDGLKRFKLIKKDATTQAAVERKNEDKKMKDLSKPKTRKIISLSNRDRKEESDISNPAAEFGEGECGTAPKAPSYQNDQTENDGHFEIDDSFLAETSEEIRALEQRIENLKVLKNSINEFTEMEIFKNESDVKLNEKLVEVQKNLCEIKNKLEALPDQTTNKSHQDILTPSLDSDPVSFSEIRTDTYLRRLYDDGTVETIYSNGIEEWLYPGSRLQYKNNRGEIVFDQIL